MSVTENLFYPSQIFASKAMRCLHRLSCSECYWCWARHGYEKISSIEKASHDIWLLYQKMHSSVEPYMSMYWNTRLDWKWLIMTSVTLLRSYIIPQQKSFVKLPKSVANWLKNLDSDLMKTLEISLKKDFRKKNLKTWFFSRFGLAVYFSKTMCLFLPKLQIQFCPNFWCLGIFMPRHSA